MVNRLVSSFSSEHGIYVMTVISMAGLIMQIKKLDKAAPTKKAISVFWMVTFTFSYLTGGIYGLSTIDSYGRPFLINGFLRAPLGAAICYQLWTKNAITPKDRAWIKRYAILVLYMISSPTALGVIMNASVIAVTVSVGLVPWEIHKAGTRGRVSVTNLITFLLGASFWLIYYLARLKVTIKTEEILELRFLALLSILNMTSLALAIVLWLKSSPLAENSA
jgi:hypothetical protein